MREMSGENEREIWLFTLTAASLRRWALKALERARASAKAPVSTWLSRLLRRWSMISAASSFTCRHTHPAAECWTLILDIL